MGALPITVAGPWRIRTAFPGTEPCSPVSLASLQARRVYVRNSLYVNQAVYSCSCKVRMSYLRKVGMSFFIRARRDDERGANRIEPTGAGSVEGTPPSRAGLSDPGGSGPAGAGERTPPAASAETGAGGGGQGRSASAAGAALEPEDSSGSPGAHPGPGAAALRRLWAHAGQRSTWREMGGRSAGRRCGSG